MSEAGRWEYACDLASPGAARADLRACLRGIPGSTADDAELVATELVTNAVRHGIGEVIVVLEREDAGIRITVTSHSTQDPEPRRAEADAPTGRGLALVDAIAEDWGWDRDGDRVTVWARLRTGAGPSS